MIVQDVIDPTHHWPCAIRRYFWTQHLRGWHRTLTAVFVFTNGLNPQIFIEWAHLLNLGRDSEAYRHFEYLFPAFERNPRRYNLYGYNVTNNQYEYLDGTVRLYLHKSNR